MTRKTFFQAARNKLLFNWLPVCRPAVYAWFSPHKDPIIVLGNQKAGTSAVAALLAIATGRSYDIDLGGLRVPQYENIYAGTETLANVIRRRARIEFSKGVIKEPNLTFLYPQLQNLYPQARFVFVVRDPRANIRSILNRLGIPGHLERISPRAYPELSPMWEAILMNRWVGDPGRELNYVGRSAERWQRAADICPPTDGAIHPIRYEDFRGDKAASIYRLAERLGLPRKNDISARVNVQYQPAGRPVTDYAAFFGRQNLATLLDVCRPGMAAYGYSA